MKLTTYFRQSFEPRLVNTAKRSGPRWPAGTKRLGERRREYRRAVRLFVRFAGDLALSAITPHKLTAFGAWLTDIQGLSPSACRFASMVGSIVRHAAEPWDVSKPLPSKRPLHALPDACCAGSLVGAYRNQYEPLRLRGKSHNAKRLYAHALGHFWRFLNREPVLSDLNCETVNRFLAAARERGLSPRTVNALRDRLLALWRFLHRKRLVDEWPDDVPPEVEPERIPSAWTMVDVGKILTACRTMRGKCGGVPAALWWEGLHRVLLDSGERISAVLGVTWDAIDLDAATMLVKAELRKGKRADRLYELHADTVAVLRQVQGAGLVFPWHLDRSYLWVKYRRLLKSAGLPAGRASSFHRMRKTVGTYYKAAGGDPSAFLGHSDPKTTRRYIDPRICRQQSAAAIMPRPVIGGDA